MSYGGSGTPPDLRLFWKTPRVLLRVMIGTMTLPGGYIDTGLPIGLQLVAAHWAEAMLIDTSIAFQDATDWHTRHPPV